MLPSGQSFVTSLSLQAICRSRMKIYPALSCFLLAFCCLAAANKFVCYFPNWTYYRQGIGKFSVEQIDPSQCTHLIYAFAILNAQTYRIEPYDSWVDLDLGHYLKFTSLKSKNPKLKTLIAIGGWNDSLGNKYSLLVSDANRIATFVSSVLEFLGKYQFDGLDIDWEYPSTEADKQGLNALVAALSDAFKPRGYLLTMAPSISPSRVDAGVDVATVSKYLDFINLMAYDLHGTWEYQADHHSPLYKRSFEADGNNVDYSVSHWIRRGAPPQKLVLGIPSYGISWRLSSPVTTPPAPASGPGTLGPYTQQDGFLAFYEICTHIRNGWTVVKDPSGTMGPYAYGNGNWVGFDDVDTVAAKTQYAGQRGLGGAMMWDLSFDDFNNVCGLGPNPLGKAIKNALGQQTSNSTSTTRVLSDTTTTIEIVSTTSSTPVVAISSTTRANSNVTCQSDGEYFPDSESCLSYYRCLNGTPVRFSCAIGTVFNSRINGCDWPANVPQCASN